MVQKTRMQLFHQNIFSLPNTEDVVQEVAEEGEREEAGEEGQVEAPLVKQSSLWLGEDSGIVLSLSGSLAQLATYISYLNKELVTSSRHFGFKSHMLKMPMKYRNLECAYYVTLTFQIWD